MNWNGEKDYIDYVALGILAIVWMPLAILMFPLAVLGWIIDKGG